MSSRDAFDALAVTDPRAGDHDDEALLQSILATPRAPEHAGRRKPLVLAMAAAALVATGAWTWAHYGVGDRELRPLILDARKHVPLPPGAHWSSLPTQILGPNSYTDPEMAQEAALLEARCHWERYWVDAPAHDAVAARGYDDIVRRMRGVFGMRLVVDDFARAGAQARRGDLRTIRQDLRVNCPPAAGGTATTLNDLRGRLAESKSPALALVIAHAHPHELLPEAESLREQTVFAALDRALHGDGSGTTFSEFGRDYSWAVFHPRDLAAAPARVRRLLAGRSLVHGSFLLVWHGPSDARRIRLP